MDSGLTTGRTLETGWNEIDGTVIGIPENVIIPYTAAEDRG